MQENMGDVAFQITATRRNLFISTLVDVIQAVFIVKIEFRCPWEWKYQQFLGSSGFDVDDAKNEVGDGSLENASKMK